MRRRVEDEKEDSRLTKDESAGQEKKAILQLRMSDIKTARPRIPSPLTAGILQSMHFATATQQQIIGVISALLVDNDVDQSWCQTANRDTPPLTSGVKSRFTALMDDRLIISLDSMR